MRKIISHWLPERRHSLLHNWSFFPGWLSSFEILWVCTPCMGPQVSAWLTLLPSFDFAWNGYKSSFTFDNFPLKSRSLASSQSLFHFLGCSCDTHNEGVVTSMQNSKGGKKANRAMAIIWSYLPILGKSSQVCKNTWIANNLSEEWYIFFNSKTNTNENLMDYDWEKPVFEGLNTPALLGWAMPKALKLLELLEFLSIEVPQFALDEAVRHGEVSGL